MKHKILFIILPYYIEHGGKKTPCPTMPYGILSIIKYIGDKAETKIFDCCLHEDYLSALIEELTTFSPTIVGINMMYDPCFEYLKDIVDTVRNNKPDSKILMGGAATTYVYKEIFMEGIDLDAICYGDGELPMMEYITTGKFGKAWATNEHSTPEKELLSNLDEVIDIDYSIVDIKNYQGELLAANFTPFTREKKEVQLYCMGSRGCIFSCKFCANSGNPDKKVRYASVDAIINHVEFLIETYGINVLSLYDEQILSNKIRAKELFRRLQPYGLRLTIPGGMTPIYMDEEMAELMWNAGLDAITLAIESGCTRILRIMRKPVKLDQVRHLMKCLRKYDFFIRTNLVIGIPEETDEDRQETVAFIREIQPDLIAPNIASPILGSVLREECIKKGYIQKPKMGTYIKAQPVINTERYSAEHIDKQFKYILWTLNFVENRRMAIGDYETAKCYFQYVADKYPEQAVSWYYLNKAKEKLGEPQDWTGFNKCLNDDPNWVNVFKDLGVDINE